MNIFKANNKISLKGNFVQIFKERIFVDNTC